ncbi:MAG TPA: hypothetical protein VEB64_05480 [Azospirillaceae bacterium]|nr:hypothetical protein [Azospirillaceae bacterium]
MVRHVRDTLKRKGETRADLARKIGVAPSTLLRGMKRGGWSNDVVNAIVREIGPPPGLEAAREVKRLDGATFPALQNVEAIDTLVGQLDLLRAGLEALKAIMQKPAGAGFEEDGRGGGKA